MAVNCKSHPELWIGADSLPMPPPVLLGRCCAVPLEAEFQNSDKTVSELG